jgi:hypothetical protein
MKCLIYPDVDLWNYVLRGVEDDSVVLRSLNRFCNPIQLLLRKYLRAIALPLGLYVNRHLRADVEVLQSGDSLIVGDYTDITLLTALAKSVKRGVKCYLWIWNPIKGAYREWFARNVEKIKQLGYTICTFDSKDAETFGLRLMNQFFNMRGTTSPQNLRWDCYFIGYAKDRRAEIEKMQQLLSGLRTNFVVVERPSDAIPYARNMENVAASRALVDIVQGEQSGLTLRPLEALACRKKLITNNPAIKGCDFYSPANVFIIGEDDISAIGEFVESEYSPVADSIVERYDVNSWLNQF